jgi:hypothetical protein
MGAHMKRSFARERSCLMEPTTNTPRSTYWRPIRLVALFSLFSLFAITPGNLANLGFLLFLMFLLPFPAKPRAQP